MALIEIPAVEDIAGSIMVDTRIVRIPIGLKRGGIRINCAIEPERNIFVMRGGVGDHTSIRFLREVCHADGRILIDAQRTVGMHRLAIIKGVIPVIDRRTRNAQRSPVYGIRPIRRVICVSCPDTISDGLVGRSGDDIISNAEI